MSLTIMRCQTCQDFADLDYAQNTSLLLCEECLGKEMEEEPLHLDTFEAFQQRVYGVSVWD